MYINLSIKLFFKKTIVIPSDENADERRLRLARQYLDSVREDMGPDADEDSIAGRLRDEAFEKSGRQQRALAMHLSGIRAEGYSLSRGHRESVTTVVVSDDGTTAYSGSKDGTIIKWDVATGTRLHTLPAFTRHSGKGRAHTAQVLALALTTDARLLASGGRDNRIHLWAPTADREGEVLTNSNSSFNKLKNSNDFNNLNGNDSQLGGHQDAVTSLVFRGGSRQLFSASADRTVKVWNADSSAYIETLYGHQAEITALDCLERERVLSAGADCTCRVWKIAEESQLVYRGHNASIDAVALVNESMFVAGSQDGALSLWLAAKKAPVDYRKAAHADGAWIASVAACKRSDLVASGASDGLLRLWAVDKRAGGRDAAGAPLLPILRQVKEVAMPGFVNSLAFAKNASVLVAGVGQEHRLGRWSRIKEAANGVAFIPLAYTEDIESDVDDEV